MLKHDHTKRLKEHPQGTPLPGVKGRAGVEAAVGRRSAASPWLNAASELVSACGRSAAGTGERPGYKTNRVTPSHEEGRSALLPQSGHGC